MTVVMSAAIILVVSALVYWSVVPDRWRPAYLLGLSVLLIAALNAVFALYVLSTAYLVHAGSRALRRYPARARWLLVALLSWLIGTLVCYKCGLVPGLAAYPLGFSAGSPMHSLVPIGLSYATFRHVHYLIEVSRGDQECPSFADYLLYVLFFPTYLAGPVERISHVLPQVSAPKTFFLSSVNNGLLRIVIGMIKKFLLADTLSRVVVPLLDHPQGYGRGALILAVYGLALMIYLDFSGYADMAIGTARVFGYDIRENFNRPFLQTSIAAYWRTWNISIYTFIRDYFFLPLFGYRASTLKAYAGIFASMLAFNLWHGCTPGFLALGVYHAAGMMGWFAFQGVQRRHAAVKRIVELRIMAPVEIALTFSFVSLGFVFFDRDLSGALAILRGLCHGA